MIRKNKIILLMFFIISIYSYSEKGKYIEAVSGFVQVDFEKEEFFAKDGLKLQYEDIQIQANRIKKENDENVLKAYDKVIFKQGDNKVEAESIDIDLDSKVAKITKGKSFTDDIYYGGEEIVAKFPDEAVATDSYFTTCSNEREETHYRFETKKLKIYPGDKIIAYNTFLYIKKYPVMWFPIYVTSLKKETKAPLFPKIGSDEEFGKYIIWGLDYGRDAQYLNGSVALKWSEKKGLLINSLENTYKINKDSTGKLVLRDTFLIPKGDYEKQWKFQLTHKHKTEKMNFDLDYKNESTNTINELDADDQEDKTTSKEKKLIRAKLKGDFKKIGFKKDLSGSVDVEYTNSEELVKELIEEASEDRDDQDEFDNDLKTILKLTKDNRNYKLFGHYENISDLDPGSDASDLLSYKDQKEFEVDLKKYKIDTHYNIEEQDLWRTLTLSEQENDSVIEKKEEELGYDLKTVKKYDLKKKEERDITIGDYNIFDTKFKWGMEAHKTDSYEKLNRDKNEDGEYFNTADIIESKKEDQNGVLTLKHTSRALSIGKGQTYEYKKKEDGEEIEADSSYLTLGVSDSKIPLYFLNDLNVAYNLRKDWYVEKDELEKHEYNLKQNQILYNNSDSFERMFDLKIENKLGYKHQFYKYELAERDLSEETLTEQEIEEKRLDGKKMIKEYSEGVGLDLGNSRTDYNYKLTKEHDALKENWLKQKNIANDLELKINNKKIFDLNLDNMYKYEEDGYENYKKDDIKVDVNGDGKKITFSRSYTLDKDISGEDDEKFVAKIIENEDKSFNYGIDKWDFKYSIGKRNTNQKTLKTEEFGSITDIDTSEYAIRYDMGKEITKKIEIIYRDVEDNLNEEGSKGEFDFNFNYLDKGEEKKLKEKEKMEEEIQNLELKAEEKEEINRLLEESEKKDLAFNLMSLTEDEEKKTDDKSKKIVLNLDLDHNKKYYEDHTYLKSLTNLVFNLETKYKRKEFGYKYTQTRGTDLSEITKKEHIQYFKYYFGEKDYEWNLGYDITFNDVIEEKGNRLSDYGITLGHKIHCTDFELAYERDWNLTDEEYDTKWTFKFWISAFPEKKFQLHKEEDENGDPKLESEFGI